MEEFIEKYPYDSLDEVYVFRYLQEMNKYYNRNIRQRIKFRAKKVYFGNHTVEVNGMKIYEQFIHLSSFGEKDKNFYIPNPCIKIGYNKFCTNCIDKSQILPYRNESRAVCIYRMSLLKLLKTVFKNINTGILDNITIQEEEVFVREKCKREKFINIRYNDTNIYYYIRIKEIKDVIRGDYYQIYCAYPVFNDEKKRKLNKLFGKVKRN